MPGLNSQKRSRLLPALLAGGACGLAGQPVLAVQLGELEVQSSLGQPLRASIAYALSPNEQIHSYCIFLKPGVAAAGLPALTTARLTVAGGRINIAGSVPIREPMLALGLTVDCPYSANLTRSYTVLLDPVRTPQPVTRPVTQPVATRSETAAPLATRAPGVSEKPAIPLTGTYRVRIGDTLSDIATRIENRPVGLWQAVDAIFAANPQAFIDGDMNRLSAGSLLQLPSFDGVSVAVVRDETQSTPVASAAEPSAAQSPTAEAEAGATEAYNGADLTTQSSETTGSAAADLPAPVADRPATPVPATVALDETGDLRPGDVQISDEQPFVSPISTDAELAATETADGAGVVAADPAATNTADTGESGSQLLYWLGGTGLALFLGFVAFRSRSRFGSPAAPASASDALAAEQAADTATAQTKAVPDIDFDIGVQADTQRQIVLDLDLGAGTGLDDTADVELAQDFGFSSTRDLDAVAEVAASDATITGERPTTDIIPAHRFAENSILDREILPSDDEYDLSMIVDATKQKFSDGDVTAKDLMAIAVAQEDSDADGEDEYTLNKEVDYKILEQDYEEEMTATQALNSQIVKAAVELADDLGETTADTAKIEAADDLAVTGKHENAHYEYDEDDDETEILTDLDDTGINEALIPDPDEQTTEMPLRRSTDGDGNQRADQTLESTFEGTVELPPRRALDQGAETSTNAELTEELPTAENDPTIEMDVESGHFRTKKLAG
jgi:FimV-like protein